MSADKSNQNPCTGCNQCVNEAEQKRSLAHDIRTPMNAIIGMAELLKLEDLSPRQTQYVGDIHSSAQILLSLLHDILGHEDTLLSKESVAADEQLSFTPDTNILVVDDNAYNIRVATGLLSLLNIEADTALSGREALKMVREKKYDLIFMDYMMPDMDGIETTAAIRALGGTYEKLPIIALTANAVPGAKEMFMENGLNGFVPKPIDRRELNAVLAAWLPREKQKAGTAVDSQDEEKTEAMIDALEKMGMDVEACLSRLAHKKSLYQSIVKDFYLFFPKLNDQISADLAGKNMDGFRICVHSLKSLLGNIGAVELSKRMEKLEAAARKESIAYCDEQYIYLSKDLQKLYGQIAALFVNPEESGRAHGNPVVLKDGIEKAMTAVYDNDVALEALEPLLAYDFGEEANAVLKRAIDAFQNYDIEGAKELLRGIG